MDGAKIDVSKPLSLSYGIHQVIARANNYQSITTYLKVGQPSAGIDIVLEPVESDKDKNDEDKKNDDSQSSDNTIDASSDYYKVYVEAPEGAEVYVDGNYIGISPVNFKKEEGSHVITLRKSGYETRSYTISVDDEEKDISFSFAELIKELPMTITGTRDFNEAIITRGGVSVKEVNPSTMESKLVEGLYFAGEVLDLDAFTGGYNLQIAWSTAWLAGNSI